MRKIIWTNHGYSAFDGILAYIKKNSGAMMARSIYSKVTSSLELLKSEAVVTRKSSTMLSIGINDIYEINVKPWKIYYKISADNKQITIMSIIDMRRNLGELLLKQILGE